jgi:hypothetical protein
MTYKLTIKLQIDIFAIDFLNLESTREYWLSNCDSPIAKWLF